MMDSALVPTGKNELQASGSAAQAAALVQTKYVIAMRCPRNEDQFRLDLLRACERSRFAEDARYAIPRAGTSITGWTIRFVETANRLFRNIEASSRIIEDDHQKIVIECSATDLESNTSWTGNVTVSKTVERRKVKPNQAVEGTRTNAYGDTVYIVRASDDELVTKTNSLVSKTLRTLSLRLLPADILEEAEGVVAQTRASRVESDPDAERKRLADAFASVGVSATMLAAYLGHPLANTTPTELLDLRDKYQALKTGESTWADMAKQQEEPQEKKPKSDQAVEALKAKKAEQ